MLKIIKADIAGWKVEVKDKVYYVGEYTSSAGCFGNNGVVYKDMKAFESGQGVCYISEYGFENSNENAGELFEFAEKELVASDIVSNPYISIDGYTRQGLIDLTGSVDLALELFESVDWQSPETLWSEWCDENYHWIEQNQLMALRNNILLESIDRWEDSANSDIDNSEDETEGFILGYWDGIEFVREILLGSKEINDNDFEGDYCDGWVHAIDWSLMFFQDEIRDANASL